MITLDPFAHIPDVFDPHECQEIVLFATGYTLHPAEISISNPRHDPVERSTLVVGLEDHWSCNELWEFCGAVNDKCWGLRLDGRDIVQYAEYPVGGHYGWHSDLDPLEVTENDRQRKVTAVLMLSPSHDYEGGVLQIQGCSVPPLNQGDVIVFPSFLTHCVTPVTRGTRRTLVCWATGPRFR